MWLQTYRNRIIVSILLLFLVSLIMSCGVGSLATGSAPSWACPSPQPLPWGPSGPIKEQIPLPTATPTGPQEYENVYYQEWEQEYPDQGPPFPSPTPYAVVGTNYTFGQRVRVGAFHVMVTARAGAA